MILDEFKLYTKIIGINEIYNFIINNFLFMVI